MKDQIGGAGAPARLRGGGGKDEESADRSRGQLAEAYQSPQMQLAAMAAKVSGKHIRHGFSRVQFIISNNLDSHAGSIFPAAAITCRVT